MMTIPNRIKDKLKSYHKHCRQSEKLRVEIEEWISKNKGNAELEVIEDILIDTSVGGNIEEVITLIENEINS